MAKPKDKSDSHAAAIARMQSDLDSLRAMFNGVSARGAMLEEGSFDPDLVDAMTKLARSMVSYEDSIRAREKDQKRDQGSLRPEVVMDWLRQQPDELRMHILRELSATLDEARSVLA